MYVIPYLNFDGQCKAAFTFYQKILGGEIVAMMTHGETPAGEHVPPEWHDRIMHARLTADNVDLMASDAPPDRYEPPRGVYVSLHIDEPEEAERIFHALEEGGRVTMPMEKTFWAERFGMLVDQFGIPWMVNCDLSET